MIQNRLKRIAFLSLAILFSFRTIAGPGDTIKVQTFTFGSALEGWFQFPPDSIDFSKILMYYTLKCNSSQTPACGEWDYLTYSYLYDHTGTYDSIQKWHTNFEIDGMDPDSASICYQPGLEYITNWQYINYTPPQSSHTIGTGNGTFKATGLSSAPDAKSLFLYRASELLASGLSGDTLTGLRLYIDQGIGYFKNLTVRLKHTGMDSLNNWVHSNNGFTTVYSLNTNQTSSGWITVPFSTPFIWNGTDNIIIEFSYADYTGTDIFMASDTVFQLSTLIASDPDYYLWFNQPDEVDIPVSRFSTVDSSITIALWCFGDTAIMPTNSYVFEGADSTNTRMVNSHLPWGNGNVYWDAGNDGSGYDRIYKAANDTLYKGQWNHWAFVKDVAKDSMRIYCNGELWHHNNNRPKLMSDIVDFTIGSNNEGSGHYYGGIDQFTIFNKGLSKADIKYLMNNEVEATDPLFNELVYQYNFNEGTGKEVYDSGPAYDSSEFTGFPQWIGYEGIDRFKNFSSSILRPQVIFETGTYNPLTLDSVFSIDSVETAQHMVVFYNDTLQPWVGTDTLIAWSSWDRIIFDPATGNVISNTPVPADTTLYKTLTSYFDPPFEIIDRYELGRFITPYGNGLSLGDGWTWVYDVTDFRPLLVDSIRLKAGNWQELLDMKFLMIEGTPSRDVVDIRNIYQGSFNLNNIQNTVEDTTVTLQTGAQQCKLRITTTGHKFSNSTNCAEFCPKIHHVKVNGSTNWSWQIIQECADNPLYPQGGTWIYDRSGWCPGMPATLKEFELTPFISGNQVNFDYDPGTDPYGNYIIEGQLVSYGAFNFVNDAAIENIISPNDMKIRKRVNPICNSPHVIIKNRGSAPLTSLDISYRFDGDTAYNYHWTGNLSFDETEEVVLPAMDWRSPYSVNKKFIATISNPSGVADEYTYNDTYHTEYNLAASYGRKVYIQLYTNNRPYENSYYIYDSNGNIIHQKSGFAIKTTYRDTLDLPPGCYEFVLTDSGNDGIAFWNNTAAGNGSVRLRYADNGVTAKSFNPDFGKDIKFQFSYTESVGIEDNKAKSDEVKVYPVPANETVFVDFYLEKPQEVSFRIFDATGKEVFSVPLKSYNQGNNVVTLNIQHIKSGFYMLQVASKGRVITNRSITLL